MKHRIEKSAAAVSTLNTETSQLSPFVAYYPFNNKSSLHRHKNCQTPCFSDTIIPVGFFLRSSLVHQAQQGQNRRTNTMTIELAHLMQRLGAGG
jgi:hypothetical protein